MDRLTILRRILNELDRLVEEWDLEGSIKELERLEVQAEVYKAELRAELDNMVGTVLGDAQGPRPTGKQS